MPESIFIPVRDLTHGDRIFMGGARLWATVTNIRREGPTVYLIVGYDDDTEVPVTRECGFLVRVDRGGLTRPKEGERS